MPTYKWVLNGSSGVINAGSDNFTVNAVGSFSLSCAATLNTTLCNGQTTTASIVVVGECEVFTVISNKTQRTQNIISLEALAT